MSIHFGAKVNTHQQKYGLFLLLGKHRKRKACLAMRQEHLLYRTDEIRGYTSTHILGNDMKGIADRQRSMDFAILVKFHFDRVWAHKRKPATRYCPAHRIILNRYDLRA